MLGPLVVTLAWTFLALLGVYALLLAVAVVTRARRPFPIDGAWAAADANAPAWLDGWTPLAVARERRATIAAWLSPCRRVIGIRLEQPGFRATAMTSLGSTGLVRTLDQPVGLLPASPDGQLLLRASPAQLHAAHVARIGDARELDAATALDALRAAAAAQVDRHVARRWLAWVGDDRARAMFTWRGAVASVRADQQASTRARRARGVAVPLPIGRPSLAAPVTILLLGAALCVVVVSGALERRRVCGAVAPPPTPIALAPADGAEATGAWTTGRQVDAGALVVTSGRIVVGDAFALDAAPLDLALPPGRHRVVLSIDGERIAFARVELGDAAPARWLEAAFAVDSGTAAFMDLAAARAYERDTARIAQAMSHLLGRDLGVADVLADPATGANLVAFATAADGAFPVLVGVDAAGAPVAIVVPLER